MITQKDLKDNFTYCEITGNFYHLKSRNIRKFGPIAGRLNKRANGKSYIILSVNKVEIKAHRAAILYVTGVMPSKNIDHIDGCGTNNAYSNIREADCDENSKNLRLYSTNNSGFCGVGLVRGAGLYYARIQFRGKTYGFSSLPSFESAVITRKLLNNIFGFSENHGGKRPL